jgi:hypothetical protein
MPGILLRIYSFEKGFGEFFESGSLRGLGAVDHESELEREGMANSKLLYRIFRRHIITIERIYEHATSTELQHWLLAHYSTYIFLEWLLEIFRQLQSFVLWELI